MYKKCIMRFSALILCKMKSNWKKPVKVVLILQDDGCMYLQMLAKNSEAIWKPCSQIYMFQVKRIPFGKLSFMYEVHSWSGTVILFSRMIKIIFQDR